MGCPGGAMLRCLDGSLSCSSRPATDGCHQCWRRTPPLARYAPGEGGNCGRRGAVGRLAVESRGSGGTAATIGEASGIDATIRAIQFAHAASGPSVSRRARHEHGAAGARAQARSLPSRRPSDRLRRQRRDRCGSNIVARDRGFCAGVVAADDHAENSSDFRAIESGRVRTASPCW